MRVVVSIWFIFTGLFGGGFCCLGSDVLRMWYDSPARMWEEALPLGNGRLGMMPDGGVFQERITLNDITMWSGSFEDTRNPDALKYLPRIRRLLLEGKNDEAQQLMYVHFSCGGKGSNGGNGADVPYGSFQLLGNLNIRYSFQDGGSQEYTGYVRGLSLDSAFAWTDFRKGEVRFHREYFVSHAGDVIVIKLTADHSKQICFNVWLDRPERCVCYSDGGELYMTGQLDNGSGGVGNRYMARMKVVAEDGNQIADSTGIHVNGATTAYIFLSAGTLLWDRDYIRRLGLLMDNALKMKYRELFERHIAAWEEKFGRVDLDLGPQTDSVPTDRRLQCFQENGDPAMAALYFQYGRYLMISGTRENTMPLNLQGLWANTIRTPWNGDYHLNINLQMNYWPLEVANLSDLHGPFRNLVMGMVASGEATARNFYGASGWVAHVITNPWGFTAPGEHASWGATNTGGAWMCEHLWEHYAFTQDKEYLREVYPVLKGAAEFFLSSMIREPAHGWLVTAPSSSPENAFFMPGTRKAVSVCMGPTMDVQIIRELFGNTIMAAEILNKDRRFADTLRETVRKLPPMQISPDGGYLQEWLEDYEETDVHHRHVSHLFGLYPSNQISVTGTPELAEAARRTLERRGDDGTGWSRAWKINFWARLHDGNRAFKLLKNLLRPVADGGKIIYGGGGTYPNLFCVHPPFQIDGNFGGCAGIAEMLLQSQMGMIELLPALPDGWSDGSYKGLCVRGGGVIDLSWKNGKAERMVLRARASNTFRIMIPEGAEAVPVGGRNPVVKDGVVKVDLEKGEQFVLTFRWSAVA